MNEALLPGALHLIYHGSLLTEDHTICPLRYGPKDSVFDQMEGRLWFCLFLENEGGMHWSLIFAFPFVLF